jgi:hypothetical protein
MPTSFGGMAQGRLSEEISGFFPPGPGTYSIEVQPRSGGLCPTRIIEFEVEEFY